MSETFMDRLIVDLKNHSHPYVTSFNGEVGDLVVTIPQVVTGVYTCTGNQNGKLIYIDHAQNKVPDMVFAVIEYGGTSELTTTNPISLFCFATVPLVNGVLSNTQIGVLLPDIDTSGSTRVKWTAIFKDSIPASDEYTQEEIDNMLLNIESQIAQLEADTTTEQTNYNNHLTDETAHSTLLNARASVESVDTLSTNVTTLEQMVTEKEQTPVYIPVPGSESLNELITVLRSSDISSLSSQLGVPITIKMADDTADSSRTITYDSVTYNRAVLSDITDSDGEITLFAWSSGNSTIYTSEVAIFGSDIVDTGEPIKNSSGDVIGTLKTTPSYMKDYRVMMTSYDTDVISDSNKPTGYAHNAKFEFLDVVCTRVYDSGNDHKYEPSDIRAYLISNAADGFLRRLPVDIRNIIVPTDIECVKTYNSSETHTLTDKVFLPSAWELCGTIRASYWYQEGTKSLYYPTSYDADATRIRYNNGSADYWWTRSPRASDADYVLSVHSDGYVYYYNSALISRGVAPAFVIA